MCRETKKLLISRKDIVTGFPTAHVNRMDYVPATIVHPAGEKKVMEASARFRCGDIAPRSGVYRVHHYAHRVPHSVIILAGTALPKCRRCGDRVQFVAIVCGEPVERDADLEVADWAAS